MPFFRRYVTLLTCILACFPNVVSGESNFYFFFKDNAQYQDVIIDEIRSADTIILKEGIGEKREVIKLIGLRAPEAPKIRTTNFERDQYGFVKKEKASPLTPIEEQAFEFTENLLKGQHVRLEFDSEKKGEDYATLAYVFLLESNTFVNSEILRQGFANLQIRQPNTKYAKELRAAYREARSEKRGLQGE